MLQKLVEYKRANNSIDIPKIQEGERNDPEKKELEVLRKWCNSQTTNQRRYSQGYTVSSQLTSIQIDKMKQVGFPVDPSYDKMYERLVTHKANTGTLRVKQTDYDDEELHRWVREQKKFLALHFDNKPVELSNDRLEKLIMLGYRPKYLDNVPHWGEYFCY